MTAPKSATPPSARQALRLLAMMTIATIAGPIVIFLVLAGGSHDRWPPDRPIEWVVLVGVIAFVLGLMVYAILLSRASQQVREHEEAPPPGE